MQTPARHDDVAELTAGYGLMVADGCHHVPAAAFEDAAWKIPARHWLGLTTPYRRDKLDDLITNSARSGRPSLAPWASQRHAPAAGTTPPADTQPPYSTSTEPATATP